MDIDKLTTKGLPPNHIRSVLLGRAAAAFGSLGPGEDRIDLWRRIDPEGDLMQSDKAVGMSTIERHLDEASEEFEAVRTIGEFPDLFDLPDPSELPFEDDPRDNAETLIISKGHLTVPHRFAAAVAYRIAEEKYP